MPRRKIGFAVGEYYHIYNRGVDRREIFIDQQDVSRFALGVAFSNNVENNYQRFRDHFDTIPIITPKNLKVTVEKLVTQTPLVKIYAYSFQINHFHLVIKEITKGGISTFMNRLQGGYTRYFNNKYGRSGSLFQGRFKAAHLNNDHRLKKIIAYVTCNNQVHKTENSITAQWNSKNEYLYLHDVFFKGERAKKLYNSNISNDEFNSVVNFVLEDRNS
jgi:REP element-mobilizing transposase RayT